MTLDMEKAIVTIKWYNSSKTQDVELPVNIEAKRLSELLARSLSLHDTMGYEIFIESVGCTLSPQETLADANVWDGSRLVLRPIGIQKDTRSVPLPSPSQMPASSSPVSGWRPLDVELPENTEISPQESKDPQEGYVWKQVD